MAETKPVKSSKLKVESKKKVKTKDLEIDTLKNQTKTAETEEQATPETKANAKAGKKSAKAIKTAEEKLAKEERKQAAKETPEAEAKPKIVKPARSRLERRGKGYRKSAEQIEKGKVYGLKAALALAVKTSHVKFDAAVELHVRLGVDPKQADQNIRGTVVLPAGTGKAIRIAVFAEGDDIAAAKKAGADIAAGEEFLQQLDKGMMDFDVLIATPAMMPRLGKYARVLGPKGLMPNPKSGTVTANVTKAVNESKAGRLEYRIDETGIIHAAIGKVSFGGDKLLQNANMLLTSLKNAKPASLKGNYVKSIYATTSMGPSIPIENSTL